MATFLDSETTVGGEICSAGTDSRLGADVAAARSTRSNEFSWYHGAAETDVVAARASNTWLRTDFIFGREKAIK